MYECELSIYLRIWLFCVQITNDSVENESDVTKSCHINWNFLISSRYLARYMNTQGTSDTREREKKISISKKVEHSATQYCAKCERSRISNFYFDGLTVVFPE